jgi:hypothetical protein
MSAITIAWTNVRRLLRDRTSAFFFVLFPMLMITVMGIAFGGSHEPRLGVVQPATGVLSGNLVAALEEAEGVDLVRFDDRAEAVGRSRPVTSRPRSSSPRRTTAGSRVGTTPRCSISPDRTGAPSRSA